MKQLLKIVLQNFFHYCFSLKDAERNSFQLRRVTCRPEVKVIFFLSLRHLKQICFSEFSVLFYLFISANIILPHYLLYFQCFPLFFSTLLVWHFLVSSSALLCLQLILFHKCCFQEKISGVNIIFIELKLSKALTNFSIFLPKNGFKHSVKNWAQSGPIMSTLKPPEVKGLCLGHHLIMKLYYSHAFVKDWSSRGLLACII